MLDRSDAGGEMEGESGPGAERYVEARGKKEGGRKVIGIGEPREGVSERGVRGFGDLEVIFGL